MKTIITFLAFFLAFFANAQVLLNESFATQVPPTGWTLQSTGINTWSYIYPGAGAAISHSSNVQMNEWLVTPVVNATGTTTLYLNMQLRLTSQLAMITLNEADLFVKVSTDGGTIWTNVWDDSQFNFANDTNSINVDLSAYAGNPNIKIAFQYIIAIPGIAGHTLQLYSVNVSSCPIPIYVTQSPAITWSMPESFNGTIDLEYGAIGFTQGSGTTVSGITGNIHTLPNMNCQSYEYFLRSSCGGSSSSWTKRFKRPLVSDFFGDAADINSTTALIKWKGFADNFVLEYGPSDFPIGTGTTLSNLTGFTQLLSNLTPCTAYTVRVKASCDASNTWITKNFTTISQNMIEPIIPTFTETFDNTNTFCSLGYQTFSPDNIIENNSLKVINSTNNFVISRKMTLTAGIQYSISIDARKNSQTNSVGVLELFKEFFIFDQPLITISNPSTTFDIYTTTFTVTETGDYTIRFRFNPSAAGSIMFYDNLVVTNTMSTDDFNIVNVNFHPNPTTSQITFSQEISNLEIYDITGKKVKFFENVSTTFDVSILEKGIYLLKGKSIDGSIITEKMVKN